jgi:soluble lytic murein transglycosylase-like protein
LWLAAAMALVVSSQAGAAIYSYRDEQGRLYLTDNPPNKNYKIVVTTRKDREGPDSPTPAASFAPHSSYQAQKFLLPNDEVYSEYINEAAAKYSLDPFLIKSVIKVESDFDPYAKSSKGAQGLMQLIPSTARLVGCSNSYDPRENILGGSAYLRMMLKRFSGKVDLALAAYNAGPGNVDKYDGVPPFRETKNYLKKVKHYYRQYASSSGNKSKKLRMKKQRVMPALHTDLSNRLNQAYEKFRQNDLEGAMEKYRDVLNIYPRNTQALYNLACLLDMDQCYEEAIEVYQAALKQDPYLDKALYNLAVIYERFGMTTEAIENWQKYIQAAKDEEKILMAERFINELKEYANLN